MQQLSGKLAIVTGASVGIGAATAKLLAESGMNVVGLARRKEKIEELWKELKPGSGKLHAVRADITQEEDILRAFKWISDNVGPIHVLVNNAGIGVKGSLLDGDAANWKTAFDTNVVGLTVASREAIKNMIANDIDGHIVNMNSIAGHRVPNIPRFNVYPASKFAVTGLSEILRQELRRIGSKIKVTNLCPGLADTDIFQGFGFTPEQKSALFNNEKVLESEDIANAVKYVIATPPHVQITELIMYPIGQTV